MADWKDKLKIIKNSMIAEEMKDAANKVIESKKHNPSNHTSLSPVIFCKHCKRKINRDIFPRHLLEVHKVKTHLENQAEDHKAALAIASAYNHSNQKKESAVAVNKHAEIEEFQLQKISDLNISLSANSDFKEPENWVRNYKDKQMSDKKESLDIIIGLDLGTSYTKSVLQFRGDKYLVDWSGLTNFKDIHTLPMELSVDPEGKISIGRNPKAKEIISSFKIYLLQNELENEINDKYKFAFVNYLKRIFRYIRAWWHENYSELSEEYNLIWNINIGLPAESLEDEILVNLYRQITVSGWKKSFDFDILDDSFFVYVLPEFSSQINTYLKSPKKQRGLHLLIDIGAGTTDICCFIVTENHTNDIKLPNLVRRVCNLGTHFLNNERFNLSNGTRDYTQTLDTEIFYKKFPEVNKEKLAELDNKFSKKLALEIKKVLGKSKQKKYKKAPEWKNGLTTFVCGGAVKTNIIENAIKFAQESVDPFSTFKLLTSELPEPEMLFGSKYSAFHRLSVAYGLSFDELNQPVVPLDVIEDDKSSAPKERGSFGDNYDK